MEGRLPWVTNEAMQGQGDKTLTQGKAGQVCEKKNDWQ